MIGPAVGGILVANVGIGGAFWLLAGIYLFGYVTLFGIPRVKQDEQAISTPPSSPVKDVVDGLKYAFGTPGINWLMVLMMTIVFWGAMQPVVAVYARYPDAKSHLRLVTA